MIDYFEGEEDQNPEGDDAEAMPAEEHAEDGDRVVASGDPNSGPSHAKTLKSHKERKIPNDQRTTTPYMTKYERARILGTRALQIRLGSRHP